MRLNLRAIDFSRFRVQDLQRPSRTVPFELNPPQALARQKLIDLQDARKPLWTVNLKARRVGFSTFFAILNSCHCIALPNAIDLTVAHRAKNAKAVFSAARASHQTIMKDCGLPFEQFRTQHELTYPHADGNSVLTLATAKTVEGARGMTLSALQLSECAFYDQAEDALTALLSTVTYQPETMLNVESTANGKINNGQAFYELWQDAVEGKNQFLPIFISWLMDPNCQMDPDTMDVKVTNLDAEEKELVKDFKATYPQLAWRRWAIPNKCIAGETRVGTTSGIFPISHPLNELLTDDGRISDWIPQGSKAVSRLTLASGRILRATPDHRVRLSTGEWRELERLHPGDQVKLLPPCFANTRTQLRSQKRGRGQLVMPVDREVGCFLGYFMGDGSWQNRGSGATCEITCDAQDQDVVEEISGILASVFGGEARRYHRPGTNARGERTLGAFRVQIAATWYEALCLDEKLLMRSDWSYLKRNVCVPDAIWKSPIDIVREFLSALFEADGFIGEGLIVLSAGRTHEQFIRDIQLLLLGCGIPSRIRQFNNENAAWTLTIIGVAVDKFCDEIGFRSERKRAKRPVRSERGRKPAPIVLTDTVVSVIDDGYAETFDIEVLGEHRFSANGIEVHNCQGYVDKFHQEYPHTPEIAFITSGDPAFNEDEMRAAERSCRPPKFMGSIEESEVA